MPLGKYYCDYCDKQFQDTPSARRRHLSGVQHQRARAHWYDSFNDFGGGPLLQPDGSFARGICHHFVRTGICKYGDACKYFHPMQNISKPTPVVVGDVVKDRSGISWGNLPPSLRPPPEGGYPPCPPVDWG